MNHSQTNCDSLDEKDATAPQAPLRELALAAWREHAPNALQDIVDVQVIKGRKGRKAKVKPAVYRLCGATPGESHVIAKRSKSGAGHVEKAIYEKILPSIPSTKLKYYGATPEKEGKFIWLFLEDVGAEAYSPKNDEHRVLAARWLATMHVLSESFRGTVELPDRGAQHYLKHLRHARATILKCLANLHPALQSVLNAILDHFDRLEANWIQMEKRCAPFPRTLVHGDFVKKNVCVRTMNSQLQLLPFDWETAGWGAPAADLVQFNGNSLSPDLDEYTSRIRPAWPGLGHADFENLARIGTIFRLIAAISWKSESLFFPDDPKYQPTFEIYESRLDRGIGEAEISN